MSITNNKYIGSRTGFSTLSPAEQKTAWSNYQKAWEEEQRKQQEMARQQEAARQAQMQEESKNKGGFFGGLGYTLESLGLGVVRSIEGIFDYTIGGIADLFGADDYADEMLKNDWVNYNHADEWYNPGKGWEFVGDVAGGIGGMLPSIALTAATGGTSALAQGLGTAAFGLGAAGQAVSEQTKKSGTATGKEWLYGTASGAAEAAIERASGGIGGMASGTVLGKQLAKSTGGKIATSFIGEGLEEVASDLLDPALKRVTGVDKEATVDWANLPRTFLVGGTTGAVMGAGKRTIDAAKVGGFNNLNAGETAQTLEERMSENNIRQAKGKSVRYNETDMVDTKSRLSDYLQRMDEPTRQTFLQSNKRISHLFNADGTLVENTSNVEAVNSQSIANLDGSTYSASLKGSENTLRYKPVAVGSEVSEAAKKALKNIELITNGKTDVVLTTDVISTADGRTANGAYVDGVLYVNANADSYARTMLVASHELTHALEDTKEYDALSAFIEESVKGDPALAEKYDIEKYRRAYENVQSEDFSEKTREYEARTEMYANFVANEILAKEDVVQRLVNKNRNVAVRLWTWLRSTLKRMSMNETERAEYDALRKAEKLLAAAIESSKGGISLEEVEQRNQAVSLLLDKTLGKEMAEKRAENSSERYSIDVKAAERGNEVDTLRRYLYRVNVSKDAKADMLEKYGEKRTKHLLRIWENTDSKEKGIDLPTAQQEMMERGVELYGDTEADFLYNMDNLLRGRITSEEKAIIDELIDNEEVIDRMSREEAGILVNKILAKHMNYEERIGKITGKTKADVVRMLTVEMDKRKNWKDRSQFAMDVAEYILNNTIFEDVYKGDVRAEMSSAIDLLSSELAVENIKQKIANSISSAYNNKISKTELRKKIEEYQKRLRRIKGNLKAERKLAYAKNTVAYKAQKLKDFETQKYANASEIHWRPFKQTIGRLAKINYKGNLNKAGTRKILLDLSKWYKIDNPMVGENEFNQEIAEKLAWLSQNTYPIEDVARKIGEETKKTDYEILAELEKKSGLTDYESLYLWYTKKNLKGAYSGDVKQLLKLLSDPTEFTAEELKALENVLDYFRHFIENYNKVYRNGKIVEAAPIAQRYVEKLQRDERANVPLLEKKLWEYLRTFADPMTVARYYDRYEDGFFTDMLTELRKGAIQATVLAQRLQKPLQDFYKKHKKFLKESQEKTIKYQGAEMTVQQGMLLYMTLKREQAIRGLAQSGFRFKRGDKDVTVYGFNTSEEFDVDEARVQAAELQAELLKQFTDVEREYISIAENILNVKCKELKRETDMLRQGYSNIDEDYYVPIRRESIYINIEKSGSKEELASVSDFSFNKDTVKGAQNQLFIDDLTTVLDKHINGISQYSSLSRAIDTYNVLFNLNVGGNPNAVISVKSVSGNVWNKGAEYFSELIDDIKGVPKARGAGNKFVSRLRSGYAKYQLGANPKVLVTQLSSFAAATNILNPTSIIKGLGIGLKADDKVLDEYCPLAWVRNNENSAALASGVLETTGKIGDVLMKPIGMMDRIVVRSLFGACQVQVQKNTGAKIGTKENLEKAGALLETVILETQQNALATERSAAMRSGNEIFKSFTMFSADSMKVTGRLIDSIGEVAVLRARIKAETDVETKNKLKEQLEKANKKAGRSIASIVTSAAFMAAVAQGFKWWRKKDEEDESKVKNILGDFAGNMLGGLPFIRDAYSFFSDGYEIENFFYASLNDLLDAFSAVRDLSSGTIKGEETDSRAVMVSLRKLLYAAGQITGIPTRNIYNLFYNTANRITPEASYKWADKFYKQSYRADLAEAIEKEDDEMISTIVGLMLNENVGNVTSKSVRKEMDKLVTAGFDVIPRSVPDKITINDEEIELNKKEKTSFRTMYFTANDKAAKLVSSTQYTGASSEVQAKALQFIYNTYYAMAKGELTGAETTKNELFASAINIETLAIVVAKANALTADVDRKGNAINGSRKKKVQKYVSSLKLTAVQKYMIMGYLGYTNANGAEQVKAYINRLPISSEEKQKLYEYSGYKAG